MKASAHRTTAPMAAGPSGAFDLSLGTGLGIGLPRLAVP